ncbi:hypothetical protein [Streptococcus suis]|nr:hypothetical protein [Streptococcus suis]
MTIYDFLEEIDEINKRYKTIALQAFLEGITALYRVEYWENFS